MLAETGATGGALCRPVSAGRVTFPRLAGVAGGGIGGGIDGRAELERGSGGLAGIGRAGSTTFAAIAGDAAGAADAAPRAS